MKRILRVIQHNVGPAILCFGVAFALVQLAFFRDVENLTQDLRMRLRASLHLTVPADEIAVVGIDERSLADFRQWPWNREFHGDLLQLLARMRPAVVTWDILFLEPTDADDYVAKSAALNRAVVFGAKLAEEEVVGIAPGEAISAGARLAPLSRVQGDRARILAGPAVQTPVGLLAGLAEIGFTDTPSDEDGKVRRVPLIVRAGDQVFPTLSLRTLMAYWRAEPDNVLVDLDRGVVVIDAPLAKRTIPIDGTGAYTINYRNDITGVVTYGYSTLVARMQARFVDNQRSDIPNLTGRILVVGQVADGLADFGPTPLSRHTPLVLVHANVVENVLREDYVRPIPPLLVWGAAFGLGLFGLAYFSERRPWEQAVFAFGVPVAFAYVAVVIWLTGSWVVPFVGPTMGFAALQVWMVGRRMLAELRQKEKIKGMFGTYVSPELVSRLVAAGKAPELGGHEAEITPYFSDIQDFSTFSELLSASKLVELMNEYLTACTDIVQAEGGALDKYIGDAVVAMFGAPVRLPDHAYRACLAAVRVQRQLAELRTKWTAEGKWPEIVCHMRSRIGLNSGLCTIGNMGSRSRFNYTMMGDNVNLAARMESAAKSWGVFTMCTEITRRECEPHAGDGLVFRPLGRIVVKGRTTPVPIHEIVGTKEEVTASMHEGFALFAQGLDSYHGQDWSAAAGYFRRSAELEHWRPGRDPGVKSNPSLVYLERVERLRTEPPPPDWDGVYHMKDK